MVNLSCHIGGAHYNDVIMSALASQITSFMSVYSSVYSGEISKLRGTCVTHVPWCMSGSLTRSGGENVRGIPGACATRNFAYPARGPWTVGAKFWTTNNGAILRMQKNELFLFTEEEKFWLPMTRRNGCWGCRSSYFRSMLDRQHESKRHGKYCKYYKKQQCLTGIPNTNHDMHTLHLCADQVMTIYFLDISPFNSDRFPCLRTWPLSTQSCLHPMEIATNLKGNLKQTFVILTHCILPTILVYENRHFWCHLYTVKNVSRMRCQSRDCYIRIHFDLNS